MEKFWEGTWFMTVAFAEYPSRYRCRLATQILPETVHFLFTRVVMVRSVSFCHYYLKISINVQSQIVMQMAYSFRSASLNGIMRSTAPRESRMRISPERKPQSL